MARRRKALVLGLLGMVPVEMAVAQDVTEVTISGGCGSDVYDAAGYCIDNPSAEDRRRQDDRNRRERERVEREKRERMAREAEFKRQVDVQVRKMGEHRRAEAEKFVRMKIAAESVRPKPKMCTTPGGTRTWTTGIMTPIADARAAHAREAANIRSRGGSIGPMQCGKAVAALGLTSAVCTATVTYPAKTSPCTSQVTGQ